MKSHRKLFLIGAAALFAIALYSQDAKPAKESSPNQAVLGRWDLTLKAPDREYPSWLELSEDAGQLKAQMVGRSGNARPLPRVEISTGKLTFVSPKDEEDSKSDLVFEGKLVGGHLAGTLNGPDGKPWTWKGDRAPSLKRTGAPNWGKPIQLFNGKDLTGWHENKPNSSTSWKVENGILVSPGHGPELISNSKFDDFKLHVEFNIGGTANSGVYLRGRYEVQIETDSVQEPPSHHTGGVYGFIAPSPEMPRRPDEWQSFDITLMGRMITVMQTFRTIRDNTMTQDTRTIIDNQEIPGITGGALDSHEALPGPIYLQGSEAGHVSFRNIVITPAQK